MLMPVKQSKNLGVLLVLTARGILGPVTLNSLIHRPWCGFTGLCVGSGAVHLC
jgi:hypothetical protein